MSHKILIDSGIESVLYSCRFSCDPLNDVTFYSGMTRDKNILTIDQQKRLLDWTHRNRSFRDALIILTILRTGLRASELRELRVSDISAQGEILTELRVCSGIPGDRNLRTIPLPNDLREQFLSFLDKTRKRHFQILGKQNWSRT